VSDEEPGAPETNGVAQEAEAEADAAPASSAAPVSKKSGDDESGDPIFEALWGRVLAAWDDDKPHQAALAHAIDKQLMPVLAGRYRKLKDDPDKAARAQKKIDGIVIAATQMMLATKTPPREKIPWQWTASAAAMFVIVMTFLYWKLFGRH